MEDHGIDEDFQNLDHVVLSAVETSMSNSMRYSIIQPRFDHHNQEDENQKSGLKSQSKTNNKEKKGRKASKQSKKGFTEIKKQDSRSNSKLLQNHKN